MTKETLEVKPNCYKCEHRGTVPGSCHSSCSHPKRSDVEVKGNTYGISKGWFSWPWDFDPTWLESCDGFTSEENPNDRNKKAD